MKAHKYIRKRLTAALVLILLLLCDVTVYGQNSTNYLSVYPYNIMTRSFSTTTEFETDQTFSLAFILNSYSKSFGCHVYARISGYTGPAGYAPTSYPVALHFSSTTSGVASNIATSILTLTSTDQLLFQETKHTQTTFYYDGILKALDYAIYKPGTYTYTITFTMTQP
jgi:hypothetical protein